MYNKRITAEDVASLAGVSRSAVSRTFTPGASVSDATRQKVIVAARKMGYRPNAIARSLTGQQSGLVAIVMAEFNNPYQSHVFYALTQALQKFDKVPMLVTPDDDGDITSSLQLVGAYQVDSAIIAAGSLSLQATEMCLTMGLPTVLMGRDDPNGRVCSVQTDNITAGQIAAEHLRERGGSHFLFVGGRPDGQASLERKQGFFNRLYELDTETIAQCDNPDYSYESGYRSGLEMMQRYPQTDAVFCACDALAFGFMDALRKEKGIQIPEQVQVIGADNVPMADWQGYQLTTVSQPTEQLANAVMENLDLILRKGQGAAEPQRVSPRLIERASTRDPMN